ncbi:hypothetical protein I4U23_003775 [Adineta vaga]|nr:hypothetical protein I4U23_003775 [Adineta vaga]
MATSSTEIYVSIQAILSVKVSLAQITIPILLIFGNIGEILNIIIFVRRTFRTNSCVIYFLAASCTRLIFINCSILLTYFALGYNIDPSSTSLIFCKLKFYVACVTGILTPNFILLACLDRLMLSSLNARTRLWSQTHFAYRLVAIVFIFWTIFSIHAIIGSTIIVEANYAFCYIENSGYKVFMSLYSIILNYLLPPILMAILGLLTIINVRRIQRQIHPVIGRGYVHRKDRYILHMLLFQVLVNVIFSLPAGVYQVYGVISSDWSKDVIQQTRDSLYFEIVLILFYVPNCAGFYIYTLTAKIFRQEPKKLSINFYHRFFVRRATK